MRAAIDTARSVGADAFIGPNRVSGLSRKVRWFGRPFVPPHLIGPLYTRELSAARLTGGIDWGVYR